MTTTSEYWTAANDNELRLPRCETCQRWIWYPRAVCPECGGQQMTWQSVGTTGQVFSWTRIRHPYVKELQDLLPLTVVVVELLAGPRVIGWMEGDDDPVIGENVIGTFEDFDGLDEKRLVFRPLVKERES